MKVVPSRSDASGIARAIEDDPIAAFDDAFSAAETKKELGEAVIGYLSLDIRGRDFFAKKVLEICIAAYVDQFTATDE